MEKLANLVSSGQACVNTADDGSLNGGFVSVASFMEAIKGKIPRDNPNPAAVNSGNSCQNHKTCTSTNTSVCTNWDVCSPPPTSVHIENHNVTT